MSSVWHALHRLPLQLDPLGFVPAFAVRHLHGPAPRPRPDVRAGCSMRRHRGPWLHVTVRPRGARAWSGAFEHGVHGSGGVTGLFALPSGRELLVVASGVAYIVPVDDPSAWEMAPILPVLGVRRVIGEDVVVLWDLQDLAAIGARGPLWRFDHLATDELCVTEAGSAGIVGTRFLGWNPDEPDFRVDVHTGRLVEGPGAEPAHVVRTPLLFRAR